LGFCAEANAIEVAALLDEAIGEGVTRLGEPVWGIARVGVGCVDIVEAMGKEGEKCVIPFLNVLNFLGAIAVMGGVLSSFSNLNH
jgi:hypothetical protein